jgi:WD40 repeat protein
MKMNNSDPFRCFSKVSPYPKPFSSIKYSWDGSFIVSTTDTNICIFSPDGNLIEIVSDDEFGHKQSISDISLSRDGRYACTCSDDRLVKLWDLEEGNVVQSLQGHTNFAVSCRFAFHLFNSFAF